MTPKKPTLNPSDSVFAKLYFMNLLRRSAGYPDRPMYKSVAEAQLNCHSTLASIVEKLTPEELNFLSERIEYNS